MWGGRKVPVGMKGMKGTRRESVGNVKRKKGTGREERDKVRECGKCEEEERYR